jgi:2-oxoglutarate/2-oxoacid ferredoxin oxidoreductase subunit beta
MSRAPTGIFRQVERSTYDDQARAQVASASESSGKGNLQSLIDGTDTWSVG